MGTRATSATRQMEAMVPTGPPLSLSSRESSLLRQLWPSPKPHPVHGSRSWESVLEHWEPPCSSEFQPIWRLAEALPAPVSGGSPGPSKPSPIGVLLSQNPHLWPLIPTCPQDHPLPWCFLIEAVPTLLLGWKPSCPSGVQKAAQTYAKVSPPL